MLIYGIALKFDLIPSRKRGHSCSCLPTRPRSPLHTHFIFQAFLKTTFEIASLSLPDMTLVPFLPFPPLTRGRVSLSAFPRLWGPFFAATCCECCFSEKERNDAVIRKVDPMYETSTEANPFKTVQNKKGSRITPSPPPNHHSNKKMKTDEIDTANRYDGLPIEDPPATVDVNEENEEVHQDLAPPAPKFRKPPPITIDNVTNSASLLKKLQTLTKEDCTGRVIGRGLRVYPNTPGLPRDQKFHRS
ncbi:hypothetical protein TNCV_1174331 [Trichonephila clavipes]|nr:hypothetical protein TNCV_1174331 [Trichonephila clavipes]